MVRSIIVWIILVLVPLLPVTWLYKLFEDQNYFELDGVVKGLVASGPIASYAFFVYYGSKIFAQVLGQRNDELSQMLSNITPSSEIAQQLVSRWDFTSQSIVHQRELTGETTIQFNNGILKLNGIFKENSNQIGQWSSYSAQVIDNSVLVIIYNMEEYELPAINREFLPSLAQPVYFFLRISSWSYKASSRSNESLIYLLRGNGSSNGSTVR